MNWLKKKKEFDAENDNEINSSGMMNKTMKKLW